jgi:hypothetical protein
MPKSCTNGSPDTEFDEFGETPPPHVGSHPQTRNSVYVANPVLADGAYSLCGGEAQRVAIASPWRLAFCEGLGGEGVEVLEGHDF